MLWKQREQLSEDMTRGLSVEKDKLLKQGEAYSSGVKHSSVMLYLNNDQMLFFMKA